MKRLACIAVLAATATVSDAATEVITGEGSYQPPVVGVDKYGDDLCVFKNDDDEWCFAATQPMVKVGWEWTQAWDTNTPNHYKVQLKPFIQPQANFISTLFLRNIWVNVLTAKITQFKMSVFLSYIINSDFGICPGIGWDTEQIKLDLLYTMKFWNCSKTLINDLADFSSTWTGYNAKYFEECSQSNNAEMKLITKELFEAKTDQMWIGTVNATSMRHCWFPLNNRGTYSVGLDGTETYIPSNRNEEPAILLAKMAYKTFFNWAVATYPDAFTN